MLRDNKSIAKTGFARSRMKNTSQEGQPRTRDTNYVINEFEKDILVVRDYDDIKTQTLIAYDAILLDYHNPKKTSELLHKIRSSVHEEVFLKPVFINTHGNNVNPVDAEIADGILNRTSIEPVLDLIENITNKVNEVLKVSSDFKGRKVLLKVIRFLYSREGSLNPIPSPQSHMGFSFPFLDANITKDEYEELIDLLTASEDRGLMQSDFVDNVHLCNSCYSGFINYRETCPKCETHRFKSQHTIHHFVCGYIGPESDFASDNKLECPKCDKQLRHIGVDYDKPSIVMECENGHVFQETEMKTFCFNCQAESTPEELITYPINSYQLTASGSETAISGRVKETDDSSELEGFVSLSVFKTFFKMEVERQKATRKTSLVSYMNLMFCPKTIKKHQSNFTQFINEIARIVKGQLKPTEVVTFLNDEVFLILSPEMELDETRVRLEETIEHTKSLIRSACEGSKNDEIVFEIFKIDNENGPESVLDQINDQINIF